MSRFVTIATLASALAFVGCSDSDTSTSDDPGVFGDTNSDSALVITRAADRVAGHVEMEDGSKVTFESVEREPGVVDVAVHVNGIRLTLAKTHETVKLGGKVKADNSDALLTELDRAAIIRTLAAIEAEMTPSIAHVSTKSEYKALRDQTPAEEYLFKALDGAWSQWPTSWPLAKTFDTSDRSARGWSSLRYYYTYGGGNSNGGGISHNSTHDCWDCDTWQSSCEDFKKVGSWGGSSNDGHANCGTSNSTQFTADCANHDQCVRTGKHGGHWMTSSWCSDELGSSVDDEFSAPKCSYDWRGHGTYRTNAPTSWDGTGDGCDCFTQFADNDCN